MTSRPAATDNLAKITALMGLCRKSGQLAVGHAAVESAVKNKRARLTLIAEDAADNTKSRFTTLSSHGGIPLVSIGSKAHWGELLGRADTAVVAVLDQGFADGIRAKLGMK